MTDTGLGGPNVTQGSGMTPRQKQAYDVVVDFWKRHKFAPSIYDVAKKMDIYPASASRLLHRMQTRGYIWFPHGSRRMIKPVQLKKAPPKSN